MGSLEGPIQGSAFFIGGPLTLSQPFLHWKGWKSLRVAHTCIICSWARLATQPNTFQAHLSMNATLSFSLVDGLDWIGLVVKGWLLIYPLQKPGVECPNPGAREQTESMARKDPPESADPSASRSRMRKAAWHKPS